MPQLCELSLCDFQKELTKRLFLFLDFLEAKFIPYSLAYGTLLGAVREQGFIPWDFDVDLFIPEGVLIERQTEIAEWANMNGWRFLYSNKGANTLGISRIIFPDLICERPSMKERPRYETYIDIYSFVFVGDDVDFDFLSKQARLFSKWSSIKIDKDYSPFLPKRIAKLLLQPLIPNQKFRSRRIHKYLYSHSRTGGQGIFLPIESEELILKRYSFGGDDSHIVSFEGRNCHTLIDPRLFLMGRYGVDYMIPKNDGRSSGASFYLRHF